MFSDTTIGCNEETLGTEDESIEGIHYLRAQISKLSLENDRCKQELHELNRKLEISRTMEAELGEFNRMLEQSLDQLKAENNRRIHETEEKHLAREKELRDKLADMEAKLAKRADECAALRETIRMNDQKLLALNRSQCSMSTEDDCDLLKAQIKELSELLIQEEDIRKQHEETIRVTEREFHELKEILAATKQQLTEKNIVVESMREELFDCRMELESLKSAPATEKSKGNSLFAEVEDRRKMILGQMSAMRASYLEAKRSFQAKEAEIRSLKAERSLFLRKWEDDTVEKIQEDASLVEKYKARIGELEMRLKDEQKKQKQSTKNQQIPENNFTFFQSLVETKSKRIEELTAKLENESIKGLIDEENKHKMGKQRRYWRYRAMSAEAELLSIKNRLESDPSGSNVEILETIKKCIGEKNNEPGEAFEDERTREETKIFNETIVTLDSLMTIPKSIAKPRDTFASNINDIDETFDSMKFLSDESTKLETFGRTSDYGDCSKMKDSMEIEETMEIIPISSNVVKVESDEKYSNSSITIIEPVLKSMLSKNNENASLNIARRENNEREKKTLRFASDTTDPTNKILKKSLPVTPKYPIVFISSDTTKK